MTVIPYQDLVAYGGNLPIPPASDHEKTARVVEDRAGLPRARYYYAGRAHPRFGDVALAFEPPIEEQHTGGANPFDTGGALRGFLWPLRDHTDAARVEAAAIELISRSLQRLDCWRVDFERYLGHFYPNSEELYFVGPPTNREQLADLPGLPAADPRNGDWRAWTWEVRLHESHLVSEGLVGWTCSPMADEALAALLRQPGDAPGWLEDLMSEGKRVQVDLDFCRALEDTLR